MHPLWLYTWAQCRGQRQKCPSSSFLLEQIWLHSFPAAAWGTGFWSSSIWVPTAEPPLWDTGESWHTLNYWELLRKQMVASTITKVWEAKRSSGWADRQSSFPTGDQSVKTGGMTVLSNVQHRESRKRRKQEYVPSKRTRWISRSLNEMEINDLQNREFKIIVTNVLAKARNGTCEQR